MTVSFQIGDCRQLMAGLSDGSVDLVVTDPPYGLSFCGRECDKSVPGTEVWKECLRVLKPGAFAFVMCSPRQDVLAQMIVRLGEAGFETRYSSVYYTFATGFPKAAGVSKLVDAKLGVKGTVVREGFTHSDEQGRVYGKGLDAGFHARRLTEPVAAQAKELRGAYTGFHPKPAVEVVLVCMKPLSKKTHVGQALANRKGVTWLHEGRIPFASEKDGDVARVNALGPVERYNPNTSHPIYEGGRMSTGFSDTHRPEGRFPANLLVSDDALNDGRVSVSAGGNTVRQKASKIGDWGHGDFCMRGYGDAGSFSRHFDLDRWWEERIKRLPTEVQRVFPFLICPKPTSGERNAGLEGLPEKVKVFNGQSPEASIEPKDVEKRFTTITKNTNLWVKPVKLLSWLIAIGSREGDLVLDPFVGSGSTLVACRMLGRNGIGFEIDSSMEPIIKGRLSVFSRSLEEF